MMTDQQVEQRVQDFISACRREGIKATHQRVEILRELAAGEDHPDAETLYESVRRRMPTISLDTVYRTLRLLEEKRVISRVGSLQNKARFDANLEQHHHFVCVECGRVQDFYSEAFDQLIVPFYDSDMGYVDSVYVELRGLCRACRDKARKNPN
jgi:Fur family peroxide stress response transcriptional regulator